MQCRFINTGFMDAYANMAIDEAILHYCQIPTLRIYGWKPSSISVGYNQDIIKEININNCKNLNVGIVRMITGGKAIYHDKEITYSFILHEDTNLLPSEINESYKAIATALVLALKKFNLNVEIKKSPEKIATSICFNSSNWYELLVNNKKISGSAQRRKDGKVLQHGSILIDFDYDKNSLLFNSNNPIDNINNLKKRITSLNNELNNTINKNKIINYKKIAEAIKFGFKENFDFDMADGSLTQEEIKLAEKLRKEKYATEEWNYKLLAKTI